MKHVIRIFVIIAVLFLFSGAILAQSATRVKFRRGATGATLSGTLNGYRSQRIFVIRVRRGQTLRTEQIKSDSSSRYITVFIKNPRGRVVGDADASCNNRKEITPTAAGDYRIEVVQCRKADAWRGTFRLKVTVQ